MTSRYGRFYFLLVALSYMALFLTGCGGDPKLSTLEPSGTAGEKQLELIGLSFFVMVGVFTAVIVLYTYVLIRYRKRKGVDVTPKQVHGNVVLEIVWTVIPIILLAVLAVPMVKQTFHLSDSTKAENALVVKVIGHQYWWEFQYPTLGIKTAQELHIPVGEKVHFYFYTKDVIHSFWVPALGGKMDLVPGRRNEMWLDAKKPGRYRGVCAELCGPGHALMPFVVYADRDFDRWVKQMKKPQQEPQQVALQTGKKVFMQNCLACHAGSNSRIPGPDLSKFGTRHTIGGVLPMSDTNLRQWLLHPEAFKTGVKMPKIDYLSPKEMDGLIQYLKSRQ